MLDDGLFPMAPGGKFKPIGMFKCDGAHVGKKPGVGCIGPRREWPRQPQKSSRSDCARPG